MTLGSCERRDFSIRLLSPRCPSSLKGLQVLAVPFHKLPFSVAITKEFRNICSHGQESTALCSQGVLVGPFVRPDHEVASGPRSLALDAGAMSAGTSGWVQYGRFLSMRLWFRIRVLSSR